MKLKNTLILNFILLILNTLCYADEFSSKNAACNTALNKGDFVSAANLADEVLKRDASNREALICKGRLLGAQSKFEEALTTLKQAESLSKDSFEHIIGNMLVGNVYKAQQKYAEAMNSYQASLTVSKADKNDKYMRANYNLIGDVQSKLKDYSAALTSYLTGAKLAMNDNERAESFASLAATYEALNQHDKAIEYQLKTVQMQKIAGTLDEYAEASLVLGQYYIAAKDYTSADKILGRLAQFAKDNGGAYYEAKANLYLAQSKLAGGDAAGAKALLESALLLAKTTGASDLSSEIDAAKQAIK